MFIFFIYTDIKTSVGLAVKLGMVVIMMSFIFLHVLYAR